MFTTIYTTAAEAVKEIKSGDRVFIHGGAATPAHLVKALQARHKDLHRVELVSITTMGDLDFDNPEWRESFFMNSLFVSAPTRKVVNSLDGDYVPVFLSQIPQLFKRCLLPIDVALIQVSPPDKHGYCTLGTSVDIARAAVDSARHIIAQANPKMPRTHGASLSEGGLPIIAMPSVTSTGISRIVPFLKEGAGVVTTRGHVHWVVTEYGQVNLFGKNLKQRAQLLVNIAHPQHREWLDRAFYQRYKHSTQTVIPHPEPKPEPAAGL